MNSPLDKLETVDKEIKTVKIQILEEETKLKNMRKTLEDLTKERSDILNKIEKDKAMEKPLVLGSDRFSIRSYNDRVVIRSVYLYEKEKARSENYGHIPRDNFGYILLEDWADTIKKLGEHKNFLSLRYYNKEKNKLIYNPTNIKSTLGASPTLNVNNILFQLVDALSECCKYAFIPNLMRPDSILLTDDGTIKLYLLGLEEITDSSPLSVNQYSLSYAAPELIMNQEVNDNSKLAVFSFGVIGIYLLTGKNGKRLVIKDFEYNMNGINKPQSTPEDLWNVLILCVAVNPEIRPTIEELYNIFSKYK